MPASKVLVLNAGSSSLKFKLFENAAKGLSAAAAGLVEQIGNPERSAITARTLSGGTSDKTEIKTTVPNHTTALALVLDYLKNQFSAGITDQVSAVGHRVVHGKQISQPTLLTPAALEAIQDAADLAPLHNPANLEGINASIEVFKGCPQVAVFDTAFHQSMPPRSYTYALPTELTATKGIRRYGFHGISYYYLVNQAAHMLGKPVEDTNLIACHLGAGSSVTAIRGGASYDTSMGLTPLEGLCMATRCGDVDASVVGYLVQHCGFKDAAEVDQLMNKKSGLLGMSGSPDVRTIMDRAAAGDAAADLALQVYVHRVRKYLGAYLVQLGGRVDAIVFSAGIGENSPYIRGKILEGLDALGISVDQGANEKMCRGAQGEIQAAGSKIKAFVIPTDEELSIAQQTLLTLSKAAEL